MAKSICNALPVAKAASPTRRAPFETTTVHRHVNPIKDTVSAKVKFMQYSEKKLLAWIFSALSDIDIRERALHRVREHVFSDFLAVSLFSSGLEIDVIGLVFLAQKVVFSWPPVDRFGKFWGGLMI